MFQEAWQSGNRGLLLKRLRENKQDEWDVVIAGGGITGAGIAREASRRGLSVLLVDRQDFAWGTSSRSSKMVHGGLRYIAAGDIKTTMHSVSERERLMNEAPGLVDQMGYLMAHYKGGFPGPFVLNCLLRI
jgi:glycerol-3-phosphate dehydrogenase